MKDQVRLPNIRTSSTAIIPDGQTGPTNKIAIDSLYLYWEDLRRSEKLVQQEATPTNWRNLPGITMWLAAVSAWVDWTKRKVCHPCIIQPWAAIEIWSKESCDVMQSTHTQNVLNDWNSWNSSQTFPAAFHVVEIRAIANFLLTAWL